VKPVLGAIVVAIFLGAGCDSSAAKPPVYLLDPGPTGGLSVRPEYISFKALGQTFSWIRGLRWRAWGGESARGRGIFETCSFGRCKRASAGVRLWRRRPRNCPTGSSYTRITYVTQNRTRTIPADRYICEND